MIYDLHTHSIHSDGMLIPAELARTAEVKGYLGIAITDHVDSSNILHVLKANLAFKDLFNKSSNDFKVIVGVEITHVNPADISTLTSIARDNGADIIIVHGETISEHVYEGTNKQAILSNIDILAHPGLLSLTDAYLAAERNVYLEITTRKSHAYTNGHIVNIAKKAGAKMVINNDAHTPSDFTGYDKAVQIMLGAGLNMADINEIVNNNKYIFEKAIGGKNG